MNESAEHRAPDNGNIESLYGGEESTQSTFPSSVQPRERRRPAQHILVVEDDPTLATLEVEVLTAHGYSVSTLPSGEQALTALHSALPDLVVLDLELTGHLSGWEVFETLRTITSIPVLITTSSLLTIRAYIHNCGETRGTLDHLPKPYPMQTLLKRVKRMLPLSNS